MSIGLKDGHGMPIRIRGDAVATDFSRVPTVNTAAYEKNLKGAFHESFRTANEDFTLTSCSVSDDGLVCSGFCKSGWNKGTTLNDGKAVLEFVYTGDAKIGVFLTSTLAFVDTAAAYIGLQSGYKQNDAVNSSGTSNIDFAFTVGNKYQLIVERRFWAVTATVKDLAGCVSKTVAATSGVGHSATIVSNDLKSAGLVVFSGTTTVTGLSAYAPFCGQHLKALILGDSITEGQGAADVSTTFSRKLVLEYFGSNAIMCGIGGTTPDHGVNRYRALVEMGYTFDYVISYLCTNDGVTESGIPAKTAQYQAYVDEMVANGSKVIWCIYPSGADGTTDEARGWMDTAMKALTNVEGLVEFDTVLGNAYSVHPSNEGQLRMYECAKNKLEILGI